MAEKIEIKFELSNVSNKCLLKIKETTECVSRIYQAIDKLEIDIHKPLPSNEFPILIDDNKPRPSIQEQKNITINWALRKGFEDFTEGFIMSFKEVYKILETKNIIRNKIFDTKEQLNEALVKIDADIEGFHIPKFIEKIESLHGEPLPYIEEIKSINQIRNCLVHRHGIVSQKDIKGSSDGNLHLKWVSIKSWATINGERKEVTYEMRKNRVFAERLSHDVIKNEKIFKEGEKISLDVNEFNGIANTCTQFAFALFPLCETHIKI